MVKLKSVNFRSNAKKHRSIIKLSLGIISLLAVVGCENLAAPEQRDTVSSAQPNIIYILADDLGYGDIGAYGQEKIKTPNLDEMARKGLLFTQHYSGSTVCAPSRATLLTGQHTGHVNVRGNYGLGGNLDQNERGQLPLADEAETVAEVLKAGGYSTGLIGKWGMGGPGPGEPHTQGFDYFFGYLDHRQAHNYYPTHLWRNGERVRLDNEFFVPHVKKFGGPDRAEDYKYYMGNDYVPDLLLEDAKTFLRDNKRNPFFLFYASTIPHSALQIPDEELKLYEGAWEETPLHNGGYTPHPKPRAVRAAMITHLDKEVGAIMREVEKLGLAENTLIIFSSDNGPAPEGGQDVKFFNASGGLRGVKRDLYEGGIRVPMIAYWPGTIKPGETTDYLSAFWDVLPTLADVANISYPSEIDGQSFAGLFKSQDLDDAQRYLYWEFHERRPVPKQALRQGQWKLHRFYQNGRDGPTRVELYDLSVDPAETKNIAESHPGVVTSLLALMDKSRTEAEWNGFNFDPENMPPPVFP